jgi:hypothetical protein
MELPITRTADRHPANGENCAPITEEIPRPVDSFRRFRSSLLALASLDLACRDHCPDVSATLTTTAFDRSSSRWLGISDLIAEPEGPSFISRTVARSRMDRLRS